MISLIIWIVIFFAITENQKQLSLKECEEVYLRLSISILFSSSINGLFSLLLILNNYSKFPIFIINISILFIFLLRKSNILRLKISFRNLAHNIYIDYFRYFLGIKKLTKYAFVALVIILFAISFGPINHTDAVNVYVGYPYLFLEKGKFFVDGDLHQAMLGIGDFSNLVFIQEKSIWFIRFIQSLALLPVILLMIRRNTNIYILMILLSSPVFIQWFTLGKTIFLSDSCLAISYLVWSKVSSKESLSYLLGSIILSICFKISSLIIIAPILIHLGYFYYSKLPYSKENIFKIKLLKADTIFLCFAILTLFFITFYKLILTGNPFYPIFSQIFTPENSQLIDFEKHLRSFMRDENFILWLIFPKTIGKIASVLGFSTGFFIVVFSITSLINFFKRDLYKFTSLAQLFVLLFFSQGRADYYACPLIILFCGNNLRYPNQYNLYFQKIKFSLEKIGILILVPQYFVFCMLALYSIYISLFSLINYDYMMDKVAFNFYNSKIIKLYAKPPVFNQASGISRLFFEDEYIDSYKFGQCFYYQKTNTSNDSLAECIEELGVKTIITKKNLLYGDSRFKCDSYEFLRAARNFFNTKKYDVDFCELNNNL